jgi:hypothetical protein
VVREAVTGPVLALVMDLDRTAAEIASRQHGLITSVHARALGFSRQHLATRVEKGRWERVHRGVYVLGGAPRTEEQRLLAAVLATNGVSSHRAGMYLWNYEPPHVEPEVTVDEERHLVVPGVVVHRSRDLRHSHTVLRSGIPTTTATRLLADIGAVLPWWYVERCIDRGIAAGHFTPNDIVGVRWEMSRQGRTGLGALQTALDHAQFGAEEPASVLEAAFARICKAAGLPMPVFQYEVRVAGRTRYIDAAWPDLMLAVEVDGFASRVDRSRFQDDRDRQNALVLVGWTVPRFTARRHPPAGVRRHHHPRSSSAP